MYGCVHVQYALNIPQTQHGAQWRHSVHARTQDSRAATQHGGDPQTLNGVGVKGLVGEGRWKSLLRLSPPYEEETNGNNFRRQCSLAQCQKPLQFVFKTSHSETRAEREGKEVGVRTNRVTGVPPLPHCRSLLARVHCGRLSHTGW